MTDPLIGACLGGRYRIERLLSAGGMGAVYEATQLDIKRRVALKLLLGVTTTPLERARFEREARALASIHSPHVVEIHDFQLPDEGPPFLVMELLEGKSLSSVVKRDGVLPPARVAKIALQVLTGLAEAHRLRIIHRDVKPANIVLVPSVALGEIVKLVDFGVSTADVTRIPATLGTAFVGTLPYMAPEQAMGDAVDGRSDVYGVGASMYYACTLRRPVEGDTPAAIVQRLLEGTVLPVASLRPELDATFAAIVDRALAHDPAKRWQSAEEMAAALHRWLEPGAPREEPAPMSGSPTRILSTTASPPRRRGRWVPGILTAFVTVLLVVGAVAFRSLGRSSTPVTSTESVDASTVPSMVTLESPSALSPLQPGPSASSTSSSSTPRATVHATTSPAISLPSGADPHLTGETCTGWAICKGPTRCVGGLCYCWGGRVWCGRECIMMDADNCGACGRRCGGETVCLQVDSDRNLGCVTCDVQERRENRPPGTMKPCGNGFCLDLSTNSLNCGACGHACDPSRHETCTAGKCVAMYQ